MVRHDYECGICGNVSEYEHPMMVEPDRCVSCKSPSGLVKKFSAPNVGTSKKGNTEFIQEGLMVDPDTGTLTTACTTREIRSDGAPGQLVGDFVLGNGKKLKDFHATESDVDIYLPE